jgi:hypothetical protein
MRSVARLTWRTATFELKALGAATIALSGAVVIFIALLQAASPPPTCEDASPSCTSQAFLDLARYGGQLMVLMAILPIAIGSVLGSQVFSREIERGTAQLPWSLSPRRGLWFAERLLLTGAAAIALVIVPAALAMLLEASMSPGLDPFSSLLDFGYRGASVPLRALAAFALAATVGLALGRTLPALLTSVVLTTLVVAATTPIAISLQPTELIAPLGDREVTHAVVRDERYRDAAGAILTINEATTRVPPGTADPVSWLEENLQRVAVGVPGRRYWAVEGASAVILVVVTMSCVAAGGWIARRRRPY